MKSRRVFGILLWILGLFLLVLVVTEIQHGFFSYWEQYIFQPSSIISIVATILVTLPLNDPFLRWIEGDVPEESLRSNLSNIISKSELVALLKTEIRKLEDSKHEGSDDEKQRRLGEMLVKIERMDTAMNQVGEDYSVVTKWINSSQKYIQDKRRELTESD